jgi:hypothetical protein
MRLPLPGFVMNILANSVLLSIFFELASSVWIYCDVFYPSLTVPEADVSFVMRAGYCSVGYPVPSFWVDANLVPLPICIEASIIFSAWII